MTDPTPARVLVLGLGNILLQDEGVGVRAVEELERRYALPPAVQALDGGTAGMALIEDILGKEHLIIVDAVKSEHPPTTVLRLENDEVPIYLQSHLSPHQLGLADVLASLAIGQKKPKSTVLIGVVPHSTELSLELSEPVRRQLTAVVDCVVAELKALGLTPTPRTHPS